MIRMEVSSHHNMALFTFKQCHDKTCFLHMQKQRHRPAAQLQHSWSALLFLLHRYSSTSFVTCLTITQIWIHHGHVLAPKCLFSFSSIVNNFLTTQFHFSSSSSPVKCRALSGALSHCEYEQGAPEAWLKLVKSDLKTGKTFLDCI